MMRKILIIMFLLVTGLCLGAEIIIKPDFNFGVISPTEINLDLRYSHSLARLYVIANFRLDPQALPKTTYHSLFLDKNVHLEQICISDKICGSILTNNLVPEHFVPDFPYPALLDSTSTAVCYSFNLEPLLNSKEPIEFRMVYWLEMPELKADLGSESTGLNSDILWFPRNLINSSTLNFRVSTSDRYRVQFGDLLNYTDADGIRTHEGSYTDEPGKYLEFKIMKS